MGGLICCELAFFVAAVNRCCETVSPLKGGEQKFTDVTAVKNRLSQSFTDEGKRRFFFWSILSKITDRGLL